MTSRKYWQNKTVLVTGGSGFLGSEVVQALYKSGVTSNQLRIPRSNQYDLRNKQACKSIVKGVDIIIHLAANVGGIGYNWKFPGTQFYDNLIMGTQLMEEARLASVNKFVAIGTVCAYPKITPVPFREEDLWNGYPEETNAPYGLAKKMLLVQAQAYRQQYGLNAIYLLPVNLYGPGDNFDDNSSHVIPSLIKKFAIAKRANAKSVTVWGTGRPTREFLYVSDAARGIVLATEHYNGADPINLGSGDEISISDLAKKIKEIIEFRGKIVFDISQPDGQPRRLLDVSKATKEFGFKANINFDIGLRKTINWYLDLPN